MCMHLLMGMFLCLHIQYMVTVLPVATHCPFSNSNQRTFTIVHATLVHMYLVVEQFYFFK